MANNIPQIGMQGIFTLAAPFNAQMLVGVPYRCAAIRKIEDLVAAGANAKQLYYTNRGLPDTKYDEDAAAGVCIISLHSGSSSWIYVPSSFIVSMPDQGGIPYTAVALALSLSAIPDSLDLTYLKSKLEDVVMENLGVTTTVREVVISPTTHLSKSEHDAIEAARVANITSNSTDYAQMLEATAQRDAALQKVQQLEEYIKSNLPPP